MEECPLEKHYDHFKPFYMGMFCFGKESLYDLITTYTEYLRIVNINIKYKTFLEVVMDFESEKCAHVYSTF